MLGKGAALSEIEIETEKEIPPRPVMEVLADSACSVRLVSPTFDPYRHVPDVQKHLHVEWDPASGTFKVRDIGNMQASCERDIGNMQA